LKYFTVRFRSCALISRARSGVIAGGLLIVAASAAAVAQRREGAGPVPEAAVSSRSAVPPILLPAGEIVREIDDAGTGNRWLLERDARHPGGPGRMVRAEAMVAQRAAAQGAHERVALGSGGTTAFPASPSQAPLIHSGDRLIVEQHSRVLDAALEAVALGPAALGGEFRVRLAVGGAVILAVATAPGRAIIASGPGERL
jgi:hypothetical protein